jgi:DNA primase
MLRKAGLVTQGSRGLYDTFRDRIMFPICDLTGDTVAFGGRSINGNEPKYLNSPETLIFNKSRTLYGLGRAKESIKKNGYVLLMEGYLDVITAYIYGFENSVAPLGTACTREQGKLIKRFVEDVVIVFDSDSAGVKAAKSAAAILLESGLNVKVLSIPGSEDPDSYLRKRGKEAFQDLLDNPLIIIDFIMRQKGDKRAMAREAIDTIAKMPDKILVGEYVRILSEKLNIRESLVMEQLKKVQMRPGRRDEKGVPKPQPQPVSRPKNEVYIIKLLIQRPERSAEVCEHVVSEDFKDPLTRSIFKKIKEGTAEFNDLMSLCEGEEKDFLTGIVLKEDYENPEFEDPEKALNDCIKSMRENKRKFLLQELQQKIKEAELKKDFGLLKQLQQEHTEVIKSSLK